MTRKARSRLRRIVWAAAALAVVLAALYAHLTNPARLRRKVLESFESLAFTGVDVGSVTFAPNGSLKVCDLVVSQPGGDTRIPDLLHVSSATIDCGVLQLLRGRVEPRSVDLRGVSVAVACYPTTEVREPVVAREDGVRLLRALAQAGQHPLPPITVRRADIRLIEVGEGEPRVIERLCAEAHGKTTDDGYDLRIDERPPEKRPLAELQWLRDSGTLVLSLDEIELQTLARVLPPRLARACQTLDLEGSARLDRLTLHPGPSSNEGAQKRDSETGVMQSLELQLQDVRCRLPIEESATAPARSSPPGATDCFLNLTEADATLAYQAPSDAQPGRLDLRARGLLNQASASLNLRADANVLGDLLHGNAGRETGESAIIRLDDIDQAELHIEVIELPTRASHPAFLRSPRLRGPLAAAFGHYEPSGKINLDVRVLPRGPASADGTTRAIDRVTMDVEGLGNRCRYYQFPYWFDNISGFVRLRDGQVRFDHLTADHGAGRTAVDGVIFSTHSWSGFELRIHGQDIALNADLYEALPEEYRGLWSSASPVGLTDVIAHVGRPQGTAETGPLDAEVRVEARLLNACLSLEPGRRLEHVDGRLNIHGGVIELDDLHGFEDEAAVRVSGRVTPGDDGPHTDLHVEVADLPVTYVAPIRAAEADTAPKIRFTGHADVWGHMVSEADADLSQQHLAVRIKGGELVGRDPDRRWQVKSGSMRMRSDSHELVSLECEQGPAKLTASGRLPLDHHDETPVTLELHASSPGVNELFPQFVPKRWSALTNDLGLAGPGTVVVHLYPEEVDTGPARQVADVEVHAARMTPRALPLALSEVTGEVVLQPDHFTLRASSARWGPEGRIAAHGQGRWQPESVQGEFGVTARKLSFSPELIEATPDALSALLKKLAIRGAFDADLPVVRTQTGDKRQWHVQGEITLREAALHTGLDLDHVDGKLWGTCAIHDDDEMDLDAQFVIREGTIAGRPIERWEGQLLHQRDERWVRLDNLLGRLCDGEVSGSFRVDPGTSDYELQCTLHDVCITELVARAKDNTERQPGGRVDGEIWLRGRAGDDGNRTGGGRLRFRDASFLQTPVLAEVAESDRHAKESGFADTIDRGEIDFQWQGDEIRVTQIDIHSRDWRMRGEGTWDLSSDAIHMTMVGAHPDHWPRVALLTDLLESAGQQLVQYRIEGTLADPEISTEPLHKLDETLRAILGTD